MYMYMYMYVYVCVSLSLYIYTLYICLYMHMYTYIYIERERYDANNTSAQGDGLQRPLEPLPRDRAAGRQRPRAQRRTRVARASI